MIKKTRKPNSSKKTKAKPAPLYPAFVEDQLAIHLWSDDPEIIQMAVNELEKAVLRRWHQDNLAMATVTESEDEAG